MRNHHYGLKRLACGLLAGVLVAVTAAPVAMADYKQKWEQAEQQLKEEKNKYNQIKDQKAKEEKKKKSLQNQQYIIKSQIKDTMGQINNKIEEIATQEQAIADQQQKIDERWAGFQDRMLAMQIMHDSGAVAMIASAKSMYDLLNFSKALQQISQKDTEVLEDMNQQKQLLEEEKAKLESAKNELESAKQSLDSKQSQLAENIRQQDQNISEQDALAQAQSEVVAQAQKNADEAERQYDAWIKQNASSGSGQSAEGFIWPLPAASPGRVTCEFGATQNVNGVISPGHKGMDIGGLPIGTPILASHNGVAKTPPRSWTYGNVVMIDNGDGVSTLYAHMNSTAVSVGQAVTQGQVIGYLGATGNVTGPHLHFEVWVGGVRQNPRSFVAHP